MIIREQYINALRTFRDVPLVKILAGIRRCGKSTILDMLYEDLIKSGVPTDHIVSMRYTSETLDDVLTSKDMYKAIREQITDRSRYYLLLDEVQEVNGWEKAVNSLLEDCDTDIYVTGSNSRLMSSEISTYLSGRYISIPVYTLSFAEFSGNKTIYIETNEGIDHIEIRIKNQLNQQITINDIQFIRRGESANMKTFKGNMHDYIFESKMYANKIIENRKNITQSFIDAFNENIQTVYVTGAGTSNFSPQSSRVFMQKVMKVPTYVVLPTEIINDEYMIDDSCMVVGISATGTSANTINALEYAKQHGAAAVALTNDFESPFAQKNEYKVFIDHGVEDCSPKSKSYICELVTLCLCALEQALQSQKISEKEWRISGSADLEEVAAQTACALPVEEYDTFGGYICGILGHVPDDGAQFQMETEELYIQVHGVSNHRIDMTTVIRKEPIPQKEKEGTEA